MNIVFFGECEKHDFALTVGIALHTLYDKKVTIASDNNKNYKYFDGEVSGISIARPGQIQESDVVIYDCHNTILYEGEDRKLFLASDYRRNSVELARSMFNRVKFDGLILAEQESSISRKYFNTYIGGIPLYDYEDSNSRKIDCVFDGRLKFKGMDDNFLRTVGRFLVDNLEADAKDVKSLWTYLKRRS